MSEVTESKGDGRFTAGFYFSALVKILGAPVKFFDDFIDPGNFRQTFGFLLTSCVFYTLASLTLVRGVPLGVSWILFVNAVAMPFITAGITYITMTMAMGRRVKFVRLFAVYSYSSGVTLLASWIPLIIWITEPWRWVLIGLGMVRGCGLRVMPAILIMGITVAVLVMLFSSFGPVILYMKGLS